MTEGFCRYSRHPEWFYRLTEDCVFKTPFRPETPVTDGYSILHPDGALVCAAGFGWNGPSGIPKRLHTGGMKYGALVHDALYGLMCAGVLSRSKESRKMADQVLRDTMKASGSWAATSWVFYGAVRVKGRDYANPRSLNTYKEVLVAP